jgi:hypothetical protein
MFQKTGTLLLIFHWLSFFPDSEMGWQEQDNLISTDLF